MIDKHSLNIGFLGGGNMARSIAGGLLQDAWSPARLWASEPDPDRRQALADDLGINTCANNEEIVDVSDILLLAVKPQVLQHALKPLATSVLKKRPLLVSIVAGIRIESISRWLDGYEQIIRVMPNTPALVSAGASALFARNTIEAAQREIAETILSAVGFTTWLEKESDMDLVTALSGSGPAYFFFLMEALDKAATQLGLHPETARLLTQETALGAAKLAIASECDFTTLREQVTSPGGTTERALGVLNDTNTRENLVQALAAAASRASELADQLGEE